MTYGDTAPYRNTPDEAHRHGRLSVAGGSGGSGVEKTDLDAAADAVRDEHPGDAAESGHPSSGTSAG